MSKILDFVALEPMKTEPQYRIVANVRTRGAIGIFYPVVFTVAADSAELAKASWFLKFSNAYELQNFISIDTKGNA